MTATQTVNESLDLTAIASENVVTARCTVVTLSEADVGKYNLLSNRNVLMKLSLIHQATATAQVTKPTLVGGPAASECRKSPEATVTAGDDFDDDDNFWQTSIGKFKFSLDALPQPLQYFHQLLKELPNIEKPDIRYYMLQCLNLLALHGDALTKASRDHRGFLIWCQENMLIKK